VAFRLRLLGEPTRIRLLEALNQGEASVSELVGHVRTTHQNVARHLSVLHEAGVVSRRKKGGVNRYALVDWTAWWLVEQISTALSSQLQDRRGACGDSHGRAT
jgi:DNA-binding transcriptional ArsR family regulator